MPTFEAPIELTQSSPEESLEHEVHLGPPEIAENNIENTERTDFETLNEDRHYPAFVHLLPIVLPHQDPEQTLDELLRRVTDRNDLHNVESVRLRVISYTFSLSRLSIFLPRLQILDLSGSVLNSLRDLGYGLLHLTSLNVSQCGLNSFDGTSGLPAIRQLIADGNMIQRVGSLAELPLLQRLSARNNRISELGLLSFLGMCPNLIEVELRGNPVCNAPFYFSTLQRSVPSLRLLDGQLLRTNMEGLQTNSTDRTHESHSTTSDENELSSLSSEPHSESFFQISGNEINTTGVQRPVSAPQANFNHAMLNLRTNSAENRGSPVFGNVLGLVRRNRRRSEQAWISSSSSSTSSLSSTHPHSVFSASSNSSF